MNDSGHSDSGHPDGLARLGALADPVRRRLYEYVAAQRGRTRRDEAAAATGVSRTLAAYHLDRLAEVGLLAVSYARPEGRRGPGAGRPAKHYERAKEEVSATVPPRNYGLLARLLADAVATDGSGAVQTALLSAAEAEGRTAGSEAEDLESALRAGGYEPVVEDNGDVELRNCPFHQLSERQTRLVCGLNHALVGGILAGCGDNPSRAELAPGTGRCCVLIHPEGRGASSPPR